jgi:hypothetical protein
MAIYYMEIGSIRYINQPHMIWKKLEHKTLF